MYQHETAAQMAAYFTAQEGGEIHHLKLVKLMYLADRRAVAETGATISNDRYYSMNHGPVGSITLDLINGNLEDSPMQVAWDRWIGDKADHRVAVLNPTGRNDLDHLSEFELDLLRVVWQEYGELDRFELADLTHEICPEWKDPSDEGENRLRIPPNAMLGAVGRDKTEAAENAAEIRDIQNLINLV